MKTKRLWLWAAALLTVCATTIGYYVKDEIINNQLIQKEHKLTGIDKQLAAWFFSKGYPDPTNLSGKYRNGWQQHLELQKNTEALIRNNSANRVQAASWTAMGPHVFGGRILSLAINPLLNTQGNNTIWAGSASGGIWRSYTGAAGATAWHPVPTGSSVLGVASIAMHPSDTNTLIAGTGEVYRIETVTNGGSSTSDVGNNGRGVWKCRGTYGIGILKTTNAGQTWTNVFPKNSSSLFAIQTVKFDPNNGNHVYACATDGLYRSLDGGNTWTNIYPATFVSDIAINPANSNQIVFSVGNMNNVVKGIWRTLDGFATTPTQLTTGLPTAFEGFITFDFQGSTLAAAYGRATAPTTNDLYTSTNFGTSWTTRTTTAFSGGQYWIAHDVELNPSGATAILAGVELYRYTFSTSNRTQIGNGTARMGVNIAPGDPESTGTTYVHDDVHDVEYLPGSTTSFLVATDGGIFKTTDNGAAFTSMNGGLQVQQFYAPSAQSATAQTLIGGLQDNNTVKYDGVGWSKILSGDGGPAMFKPGAEATLIASRDARDINLSTNSGATFTNVLDNLGQTHGVDERTCFMAPMAVSKNNTARMYVASDNLHISTNSGATFTKDLPTAMTGPYIDGVVNKPGYAMGVSNLDANKLYISMSPLSQQANDDLYYNPPANIRKSTNGGTSFTTVSTGLPDRYVTDFAISETFDDSVFITLGGFGTSHIYVSGNGGTSWTPLGSGLPDVPFNTIMFDPVNPKIVYAGSDFGVYVSPDRGMNWMDFNTGLWDATYVVDLVPAPGNKMRAVTHGKGVFESSLYIAATLPVNIHSFNGYKAEKGNALEWSVSNENNMSHYVLERSNGSDPFIAIANIKAVHQTKYTKLDAGISGAYYYRLRAVNADGSYTFSKVVYIFREVIHAFIVKGNPFYDHIDVTLHVPRAGRVRWNLYDMRGRLVRTEATESFALQADHRIRNMQYLPNGMYQLEAITDRRKWTQKILKN